MRYSQRSVSRRRLLGSLGVAAGGTVAGCLGGDGGAAELDCAGDPEVLADVERHPSEGTDHVEAGTEIDYDTRPPTSGPHYDAVVDPGFYEESPAPGALVHTLEHGAVIAYYDPGALSESAESDLRERADRHTDTWASFVAVPFPYDDPETPYALTAWRHLLRLEAYDADAVDGFVAEFIGRGPENPVRTPCE